MKNEYKKILLCVTGLSPQIITETLYALAVGNKKPWIPDEIHVITTNEGAERIQLTLFDENPGWFSKLVKEINLPYIKFDSETIHIIKNAKSEPMVDIRTPDDNTMAADYINNTVNNMCKNPKTQLHVSLAGGRKTMGFYVGYALSLHGRQQDKLSHVLVSSPFEANKNFYFPTKEKNVIYDNNDKPLDSRKAEITLAEIPFVRMKQAQDHQLEEGKISFSKAVEHAQQVVGEPNLIIDFNNSKIIAQSKIIKFTSSEMAFYNMMVSYQLKTGEGMHYLFNENMAQLYKEQYLRLENKDSGHYDKIEQALKNGMDKSFFESKKSKINRTIKQNLGKQLARPYELQKLNKIPNNSCYHFGVELKKEQIKIKNT